MSPTFVKSNSYAGFFDGEIISSRRTVEIGISMSDFSYGFGGFGSAVRFDDSAEAD